MVLAALSVSRLALVTRLVALCPSHLALVHLARLVMCQWHRQCPRPGLLVEFVSLLVMEHLRLVVCPLRVVMSALVSVAM